MRRLLPFLLLVACGEETVAPAEIARGDTPSAERGGSAAGGSAAADPRFSYVRVLGLVPNGERVDACLAKRGTDAWIGPILAKGTPEDPGVVEEGGVALGVDDRGWSAENVASGYVKIPPGTYDVRLVASGGDCGAPLAEVRDAPALSGGKGASLTWLGPALAKVYVDEFYERAVARFVHAAAGVGAVDFRVGSGLVARNLATGVVRGGTGTAPGSESGYVGVAARAPLSVGNAGKTDTLFTASGSGSGGTTYAFVGAAGSKAEPLGLVACRDAPSRKRSPCRASSNDLSAGPTTHVRYAHLPSTDVRDVAFCYRKPGETAWRELFGTLQPGFVTRYQAVPAGAYELKTAKGCNAPAIATADATFEADAYATAIGWGTSSLRTLADRIDLDATRATIRFVHAAPGVDTLRVGTGVAGSFQMLGDGMPYGGVPAGGGVDPKGYASTGAIEAGRLTVRDTTGKDVASRDDVYIGKGETWTVFVTWGNPFNSSAIETQVMPCFDTGIPLGERTGCRDARNAL